MNTEAEMKCLGSPMAIEVLLHCHYSAAPFPEPREVHTRVINDLHAGGFIEVRKARFYGSQAASHEIVYKTTPRGAAWVRSLCRLPPPTQIWVDHLGPLDGK